MLPKFGTKAGKRVQLAEARQRERKLTGNNREIRVFDPSGSTPGTMSPWMPLWALFNDELLQRCEQGREPKMRAPYNRSRRDYKSSIENGSGGTAHHATKKKSPAQLQREINEVLATRPAKAARRPTGKKAPSHSTKKAAEGTSSSSETRVLRSDNFGRLIEVRAPAVRLVKLPVGAMGKHGPITAHTPDWARVEEERIADSVRLEGARESGHDIEGHVRIKGKRYSAFASGGPDDFVIVVRDKKQ